jgi:hypothetical protein
VPPLFTLHRGHSVTRTVKPAEVETDDDMLLGNRHVETVEDNGHRAVESDEVD